MSWLRYIGGRLKSDYKIFHTELRTTFKKWPGAIEAQRAKICELAQDVLDARAKFANAALADLYDADLMEARTA